MPLRILALASSVWVLASCPASTAADADLILHHGRIVAVDPRFSVHAALAVRDGRILRSTRTRDQVGMSRLVTEAEQKAAAAGSGVRDRMYALWQRHPVTLSMAGASRLSSNRRPVCRAAVPGSAGPENASLKRREGE